jgi:hypothetical protein
MILVTEKMEVLKMEKEMILLKETTGKMTTHGKKALIKMMELVMKKKMGNANPQNYHGNGDGGNKYQKDEGTERNDSADGHNRNGDENDGGGEAVGVEEGEKEKNPIEEGSIKMIELVMKNMVIMIHHHLCHHLMHSISATGHKKSTATCLNLHN